MSLRNKEKPRLGAGADAWLVLREVEPRANSTHAAPPRAPPTPLTIIVVRSCLGKRTSYDIRYDGITECDETLRFGVLQMFTVYAILFTVRR